MDTPNSSVSSQATSEASQLLKFSVILKDLLNIPDDVGISPGSTETKEIRDSSDSVQSIGQYMAAPVNNSSSDSDMNNSVTNASGQAIMNLLRNSMNGTGSQQQIILQGDDSCNSFSVYSSDVTIVASTASSGLHTPGSNKVKTSPVVNYDWESKYYVGNLVAIHRDGIYAAYSLSGKSGGVVRIVNRKTAERTLLKGFMGKVIDISFANLSSVVFAGVDEIGNMFIYELNETMENKITTTLLLQVNRPEGVSPSDYHRVIWCPYIPDEEEYPGELDDNSKLLVLTHENVAEMWSIDIVTRKFGCGPLYPDDIDVGYLVIDSHTKAIMDASFSPDGTALATASLDGEVKFFQVYMHESTSPRCLHQWKPHEGKPLSCLFFLDDHKHPNPDVQFWKYAVTGADNNNQIKVWSCESWTCLQTINFTAPNNLSSGYIEPIIKANIDLSASYMVLSDIKRSVLYILHLHQDATAGKAHVSSVSEFILANPCLSYAILDASRRKFKRSAEHHEMDDVTTGEIMNDEDEEEICDRMEEGSNIGVLVKMYSLHSKALQELQIRFKPESSVTFPNTACSVSSVSQDEIGLKDGLSDMSMISSSENEGFQTDKSTKDVPHPVLLTPDAFTSSPVSRIATDTSASDGSILQSSTSSSFTHVTAMLEDQVTTPQLTGSPSSSITLTPSSTASPGHVKTPSSVPLPPVTPGEERKLMEQHHRLGQGEPPVATSETIDAMFGSALGRRQVFQSTGSSSSASLEVSEIFSQSQTRKSEQEHFSTIAGNIGEEDAENFQDADEVEIVEEIEQDLNVDEIENESSAQTPEQPNERGDGPSRDQYDYTIWPNAPLINRSAERAEAISSSKEDSTENQTGDDSSSNLDDLDVTDQLVTLNSDLGQTDDIVLANQSVDIRDDSEPVIDGQTFAEQLEGDVELEKEDVVINGSPREPSPLPRSESTDPFNNEESMLLSSSMSSPDKPSKPQSVQDTSRDPLPVIYNVPMKEVNDTMQQMSALLREHQNEVQQLRYEVQEQRTQLNRLEHTVGRRVEGALTQHSQSEQEKLHGLLGEKHQKEQIQQEQLLANMTQSLQSTLSNKIDRIVKQEIKNNVIPTLAKALDPLKDSLHQEMAQKLTATDSLMKENISKLVRSKQTTDAIGQSAGQAIQGIIQASYKDAFQAIVVPVFERSCHNLFRQMNDTFQQGTREYTQMFEGQLDKLRKRQESLQDPIVSQLQGITNMFKQTADSQAQVMSTLKQEVKGIQSSLTKEIRSVVKTEMASAMKEQQSTISDSVMNAVRTTAATPVPIATQDPHQQQTHIVNLLAQGQLNTAFQQALSASDLNLVIFVCETVNPTQVFHQTPCPLEQPVLLSLIQQLSADLETNTELKHQYLEEAVMNLDSTNPVTREHMPIVLHTLCQKIHACLQTRSVDRMTRPLKMLLMASQSLLK
ncbi:unnamed protein product [Owenia fusiformis]|uniref:Uncharacterized protein n=1 Tax=Owenia fusiformis TaxID=6347 RepID=A0A8J1TTT9_OWEFU|nr:unnamed protein product [Owenia fusiformis]